MGKVEEWTMDVRKIVKTEASSRNVVQLGTSGVGMVVDGGTVVGGEEERGD